jgi:hypothetical protein
MRAARGRPKKKKPRPKVGAHVFPSLNYHTLLDATFPLCPIR